MYVCVSVCMCLCVYVCVGICVAWYGFRSLEIKGWLLEVGSFSSHHMGTRDPTQVISLGARPLTCWAVSQSFFLTNLFTILADLYEENPQLHFVTVYMQSFFLKRKKSFTSLRIHSKLGHRRPKNCFLMSETDQPSASVFVISFPAAGKLDFLIVRMHFYIVNLSHVSVAFLGADVVFGALPSSPKP